MGTVKTGIPGLDELLEGGYIENDIMLVTGGPGAGKTTFGLQYLIAGAWDLDEPGVLVTLEETPSRILRNSWRFGWDLEKLIAAKKLKIIYASPFKHTKYAMTQDKSPVNIINGSQTAAEIFRQIQTEVDAIGAKRIFIDSITSLKLSSDGTEVRYIVSDFIKNLEYLDCTTIMSSEVYNVNSFNVEEYLVSGVIRMHIFRAGGARVKAMEILKMRGVKHDETLRPYEIQDKGIIVHSNETVMNDEINLFNS